ncbi:alpha-ketoglutarate-dependent dioxygenase AlkB [Gordonia sp. ABSL1-1]|uniref:alpha-ketoglutarate-dependent dioxygenase AlkB n=1 Tax=Gordonia sp. ABSL1-1 TaxID=3053923 RepID=UPI0025733188|nr:alpha-ketoglutarate-dependent dioxygenase AlkB [Gordonia sp. ABSL1-1]MDL9937835.1 alpha-ketoglutarate-dependent dioxygenase AlkB [Gordonia sp. ABSL1-1]
MPPGMQTSIFDVLDVPDAAGSSLGPLGTDVRRRELTDGAWVDLRPGWLRESLELFDSLTTAVPWRAERRQMYDQIVDVPRLVAHYAATADLPAPELSSARSALTEHYRAELPEGFATLGLCHYRDGADSVAWHGDRFGRGATDDTLVAILSLGAPRPLLLRPRGGGRSLRFTLSGGDLLVMGGSCQRTWEHCVPKTPGAGARISIQFRAPGVW